MQKKLVATSELAPHIAPLFNLRGLYKHPASRHLKFAPDILHRDLSVLYENPDKLVR